MFFNVLIYLTIKLFILFISEKVFIEVVKVKEQIKEIFDILQQRNTVISVPSIPDDLTVEFPLKTREELQILEDYLNTPLNKNAMVRI